MEYIRKAHCTYIAHVLINIFIKKCIREKAAVWDGDSSLLVKLLEMLLYGEFAKYNLLLQLVDLKDIELCVQAA